VVSFNVKLARAVDQAIALLRTDPALRHADIVALQEMDEAAVDSIARALGLNYVYFPTAIHPSDDRAFGPAVLTPWPIDSAWKLVLPHESGGRHWRRTATAARVLVAGSPVRVYSVHLEIQVRVTPAERRDQMATVLADAARATEPVVIAGDLNSWTIGDYVADHGYAWATRDVGATTMGLFGWDHVFARGLAVDAAGVRDADGASDHRPVWAILGRSAPAATAQ
jgi:endonuclease/exonuclease/phosphatase family metal-dependent hydrolase